ncbi:MAG: hypothetical protein WEB57_00785 [Pseudohongiellaceae bacterium]
MAFTTEDRNDVISLAVAVWNAAPGAANLSELAVQFNNGASFEEIAESLTQSEIFTNEYPAFLTNEEFAEEFVANVVGGQVSADDEQWAVDQITGQLNGGASHADVIIGAIEALNEVPADDENWGNAAAAFNNKVEVATYFSVELEKDGSSMADLKAVIADVDETDASVEAAKSSAEETPPEPGETFNFTSAVGEDINGTSGNDTFKGVIDTNATSTINTGDTADGGAGTDRLNIIAESGAGVPTGFDASGIENVFITNGSLTTVSADSFSDVEQLWLVDNEAVVSVEDLSADITFGLKGAVSGAAAADADITGDFGSAESATLAVDGFSTFDSGESTQHTLTVDGDDVTELTVSGTTSSLGLHQLSGTAVSGATTINLAVGAGALVANLTNAAAAKTVNVSGVGPAILNLSTGGHSIPTTVGTIDSSAVQAPTGGVRATTDNDDINVIGGAGSDRIMLDGTDLSEDASIELGGGDDFLMGENTASLGSQVVDGGAGSDTIAATFVTVGSAGNIQNFEVLDLAGFGGESIDAELLTESSIDSLAVTDAIGGIATVENLPGTTALNVSAAEDNADGSNGSLGSVDLQQAGASSNDDDSLAINFAAAPTSAAGDDNTSDLATVTVTGTETIDIASGGGSNQDINAIQLLQDKTNSMEVINISGDVDFVLDGVETGSANTAAAGFNSSLTLIDGSEAEGDLTISAGEQTTTGSANVDYDGLTINGGSGDDAITNEAASGVVDGGAGKDVITLTSSNATVTTGSGTDTVDVSGTTAWGTSSIATTITDLAEEDVVDFDVATLTDFSTADISGAQTLDEAVDAASAANEAQWFEYSGNTYIVADVAGDADHTNDLVVKLTGSVDLSDATLDTANGTVTMA